MIHHGMMMRIIETPLLRGKQRARQSPCFDKFRYLDPNSSAFLPFLLSTKQADQSSAYFVSSICNE